MGTNKQRSLEIHEHLDFQRRFRVFQKIGTAALLAFVVAAFAGLLGSGPLSSTGATAGALKVDYDRFQHRGYRASLKFQAAAGPGPTDLVLHGALLDALDITHVAPQPEQVVFGDEQVLYRFAHGTTTVHLQAEPQRAGPVRGRASSGSDSLELHMFVYP